MNYQHGIYGNIANTIMPIENISTAGVQVVVGTAPINMLANPALAVGIPILLNDITDVQNLLGYSTDLDNYTIMQAVHAMFEVFNTAPIVVINVLDPIKHATPGKTSSGAVVNGAYTITDKGVLPATLVVTDTTGATTYANGTDYTYSFNTDGTLSLAILSTGAITPAQVIKNTYSILDPTKVLPADIIAGIDLINRVYQATDIIPAIVIAPGFSQNPTVGTALIAAAAQISTVFKGTALLDIDSKAATTITAAIAWKNTNNYANRGAIVCYPKVTTNQGKIIFMSAMLAALMQTNDALNESTPFVSPSNKVFNILTAQLDDTEKTQVMYTLDEANQLNGEGIFTALKFQGWKAWGNNMSIYSWIAAQAGTVYDPKDQFINIKRAFDWQNNGFITRYFTKIDNPMNLRAIQTLITDENQFYNPYITAGFVAGMSLEYNQADNPISQILAGVIKFRQHLAPYTPMQTILNTLQFDPTMLENALGGVS